ncbi:YTH domain-containing family protein [Actinidia chinensis var. chinensis]|uniref:YTH domain-containing family protein n=1 Tax=Actinidia chinensis var. chinensis TaxID=1590841 RepID=A0A2R6PJP9_ACTCC|nr:YTH domain-containing family protein [Actinidia chinensis var. chinensis]
MYYIPSHVYTQSPYNPYNPNIPGAMLGADDPFIGTQQYYNVPYYEYPISSPTGFPMVFQSGPEFIPSNTTDPYLNTGFTANRTGGPGLNSFTANRAGGTGLKNNLSWASATLPTVPKPASNQTRSFARVSEGSKANAGPSKLPESQENFTYGSFSSFPSSQVFQGRGVHAVDNISQGKAVSHGNQLKVSLYSSNDLSNFGSGAHGWPTVEKSRSKFHFGRVANDVNGSPDALIEQNRDPRTIKSKNYLAVKAYTTRAGDSDIQGNITIYTDQYNKVDFSADYVNAKFFVIKSYSEDDVHKGIKYNVWSSTTNGNNKLQNAYEDARRIAAGEPRGCPIFLFFSVNASGQFCGVAEMTGTVDFHKDMDFWQQNKWSGNFPVKWHIIKDVPNPNFRHIILENNENKPVTNSRDTQEIRYKQGIEMLKIFKNHAWKTSLLDDFMYYENRQKIMQEEKTRLLIRSYGSSFLIPALDPPRKQNFLFDTSYSEEEKTNKPSGLNISEKTLDPICGQVSLDSDASSLRIAKRGTEDILDEFKDVDVSPLTIGSVPINPEEAEYKTLEAFSNVTAIADTKIVDVTVGSMPVRVDGYAKSSGLLTIGTISIDPKSLHVDEAGITKNGSQH